jgi:vacuolar-type H+-ATPase subunit I/STV1
MAALDMNVDLGSIVALCVAVTGGLGCVFTVRSNVKVLSAVVTQIDKRNDERFTLVDDRNEERFNRVDARLEDYGREMKQLSDIMIKLTEAKGAQAMTDQRILQEGARVDDLNKRIDAIASTLRELIMERRQARAAG